jgi:predicted O-methyltransferase YrrM
MAAIEADTKELGFSMGSDRQTGSFLRSAAASKPQGALLELGTGTGIATSWLLDGMDERSRLVSVDVDEAALSVARRHLGADPRVTFLVSDAAAALKRLQAEGRVYDLIFADAWPGKYSQLDEALSLVAAGGLYVVDDMSPQPSWPPDHQPKVARLVETLAAWPGFRTTTLSWSTGLVVAVRGGSS